MVDFHEIKYNNFTKHASHRVQRQEDLLTKADLTFEFPEKLAVAEESAKFSQAEKSGEGI